MDQYIGRLLDGRYEILEILGTGGMAVVYKARCHRLNRLVAIKILKDELSRDEEFRRRFHAEGEAVAMLSHPNIVQVYDVSSTDNANFIVMELVDGISLKQYMEKKGTLNWKETLHFAMQIAKGLEHAHSRGIVHRDIKPHNVMVLKNGSVKVMDFGIARVMSKSSTLTKEALGSVHYISPEQAKGGYTDNRSDLYSLSVVMYEMMTGRPPYDGESPVAVAIQHINGGAVMPSVLNPNIPGGLEQIIMKGMALELKDRYPSATELLQDMEEFRKNPAIQFQHIPISENTRLSQPVYTPPRTTAERMVQRANGAGRKALSDNARMQGTGKVSSNSSQARRPNSGAVSRNTGSTTDRNPQDTEMRRAQQRRREAEKRREAERSRIATIAVVACSVVAIVAIVVFLVALFNGALLNRESNYVEVPELVGDMYSEGLLAQYEEFNVILQPQEYSAQYQKGQIMHQNPLGGEQVAKGTELRITVSMGPEPKVKIMQDLINVTKEEAESYLKGQGFAPLFRNEASYIVEAGCVTRTDPAKETELEEGQTIIVWISTGPAVVLQDMPDVMGLDLESAKKILNGLGFDNVRFREVESNKPKGTVVYQSQEKGTELDVTQDIFLEISQGPDEAVPTTQPTTQPTENTEATEETVEPVTQPVTFAVPAKEAAYVLSIQLNNKEVVEAQHIQPGVESVTVELTNSGRRAFDLYIDGEYYRSQEVMFGNG